MKPISPELSVHIAAEVTSLATCWKLTRSDGVVLGFTSHDCDIVFEDLTYLASSGFVPSAVASNCELSVDNMEIEGIVDGVVVKEDEIIAGKYDLAKVEIFMLGYKDVLQGKLNLRSGWIGEIQYGNGKFIAEVRGLMQSMVQIIGQLYSPSCRAKFCDSKCGLNITNYTVIGNVSSFHDRQIFTDLSRKEVVGWFSMGKVTFLSGKNSGLSMEIKEFQAGGIITLVLSMPYAIEIGDRYSLQAGCSKTLEICTNRFNNSVNFRGEPHVPGIDSVLRTAGTR